VLLVTEPTPFGLHDLKLAVQVVHELDLPAGVILNRDGVGNSRVDAFCQDADIPILMRIPLDHHIGRSLASGITLVEAFPEYLERFRDVFARILTLTLEHYYSLKVQEEVVTIDGLQ
jgi:MinD superfamily P-loop ATPase